MAKADGIDLSDQKAQSLAVTVYAFPYGLPSELLWTELVFYSKLWYNECTKIQTRSGVCRILQSFGEMPLC